MTVVLQWNGCACEPEQVLQPKKNLTMAKRKRHDALEETTATEDEKGAICDYLVLLWVNQLTWKEAFE